MMKKTVLITGASSGIGLAVARHFAHAGYRLILTALPGSEFEDAAHSLTNLYPEIDVLIFPGDLTDPEVPDQLWSFIQDQNRSIDVFVNNAGVGTWGQAGKIEVRQELKMIDLNIRAAYVLTRIVLKHMQENRSGHIIFIASIAAFQPNPYMAAYGATKAFIRSFGLALHHELKEQGSPVRILMVCPPAIPTAFQATAGMQRSALFSGWLSSDVETVAKAIWSGFQQNRRQVIPTWYLTLLAPITRLLPESLSIWMAKRTLQKNLPE